MVYKIFIDDSGKKEYITPYSKDFIDNPHKNKINWNLLKGCFEIKKAPQKWGVFEVSCLAAIHIVKRWTTLIENRPHILYQSSHDRVSIGNLGITENIQFALTAIIKLAAV